jgi:diguanylate cyclase (GGDEF)-like protein
MSPKFSLADGVAALLCLAGLATSLWLRGQPELNGGPLFFSAAVLVVGLKRGPLEAWILGLLCGLFTTLLFSSFFSGQPAISLDFCLASLSVLALCTLFPIPWTQDEESLLEAFERRKAPLEEKRDFARDQLERVLRELGQSEQKSREIDALYHAGREISKLLTLQDTLDFSREIIRDTLQGEQAGGDAAPPPAPFVLMLVDEDAARFRLGTLAGIDPELAQSFEAPLGGQDLMNWLKGQGKPLVVVGAAADARLKGLKLLPQLRGFSSVPLLIQDAAIGIIVVFDFGGGRPMEGWDFSNLRILASQVAIGIEKATLYDKVQRLSITDGLTGLFVHRHFQARLDEEIKRAERYKEPLSLLMLDIDHFKKFNDSYGHLAGDAVLKRVASLLGGPMEGTDIASRYGGEEFALILPKQDKAEAALKAEAIRAAVEAESILYEGQELKVTVSMGLAALPQDAMTKKGLIDKADQALYKAKHDGRNRLVIASLDNPGN